MCTGLKRVVIELARQAGHVLPAMDAVQKAPSRVSLDRTAPSRGDQPNTELDPAADRKS